MASSNSNNNNDTERQLMIKVKACQRLTKEVAYYVKELKDNEEKLETMKDEGRDIYDIKKFEEVVGESSMMIPDSKRRLNENLESLRLFLDTASGLSTEGEFYAQAQEFIRTMPEDKAVAETTVEDDAEVF
mmetsp:Transcript_14778/g.21801  ORF Transcript_14778/g.21801 Transcript_14778/m.21801 type:complete len:131 (-) Transcript_14778:71-463(-)